MSDSRHEVRCPTHGARDATFVCQHLPSGSGVGFHQEPDPDDPDALWPDAWCDACETMRVAEGEWNERSKTFAGIRVLCAGCYQTTRARNWKQDDDAFRRLGADAAAYLRERQDHLATQYKLGSYSRYDWSQDTGQLVFSDGGRTRLVADIQFVGSISTQGGTWLWSWANTSILESVKDRIRQVRAYGEDHHYLTLACACSAAREVDGWQMTAVTAYLTGAAGAYRTPSEDGFSFMAITDVHRAQ